MKIAAEPNPWKDVPSQYASRWSYDYNERTNMFDITANGYGIASTEESEIAHAICVAHNEQFQTRMAAEDEVKRLRAGIEALYKYHKERGRMCPGKCADCDFAKELQSLLTPPAASDGQSMDERK